MNDPYQITERPVRELCPYPRNARTHSKKQIRQIAASIERFGFTNPILVSDAGEIIAGHGRVEAAKLLGMKTVPTVALSHLSEAERRAYVLADNKLALNAGWDQEVLAIELQGLIDLDFDLELTDREATIAVTCAFNTLKQVVEPGGAAALASILARKHDLRGKAVAVVLCSGNIELVRLHKITTKPIE